MTQTNINDMNTLENKFKFFAQYWEQKILTDKYGNPNTSWIDFSSMSNTGAIRQGLILLKPLSIISGEEARDLYWIVYQENPHGNQKTKSILSELGINDNEIYEPHLIQVIDYLRSKGYALPFMNFSVDQLIEMGWIRLIKK